MRVTPPMSPAHPRRHPLRIVILLLVLLALLYLAFQTWQTYRHVAQLRAHLSSLRSSIGSPSALGVQLVRLQDDLVLLRRDLWLPLAMAPYCGWIPVIGPTVQAAPRLFTSGELLLGAGVTVWNVLGDPLSALLKDPTTAGGVVPMASARISAHAQELEDAAAKVHGASELLHAIPAERLLPQLREPVAQVQALSPLLTAAFDGLPLFPRLVDQPGEGTHLLLAQNNDELRATGGFISSIGTLTVTHGIPRWAPFEDSYAIEDWSQAHPDPPAPLNEYMGLDLWVTRDGNWWPDFPTSARAVAGLYELNQGGRVDGVMAADMAAAARLVEALAPLDLPGQQRLEKGHVLEAFRQSWGLPPGSLMTPGIVITATQPFTAVQVALAYSNKEGKAWFDSVEVVDLAHPEINLVRNPSFEEDDNRDGLPDDWQMVGLTKTDHLVTDYAHSGRRSLLIVGDPQSRKGVAQRLPIRGESGTELRLSAQSRAEDADTKGGTYALTASLVGEDGKPQATIARFPVLTHDWATAGSAEILARWWAHRKDLMNQVTGAALKRVLSTPGQIDWPELFVTVRKLLDERHVQLYVQDPAIQALLVRYGWAGALVEATGDYLSVVDSNLGYNKVTATTEQSLAYDVTLDASGEARATLTIRYHNRSTAALAGCNKFRQYVPTYDALTQGCYWDYVRIYVPAGAELLSGSGGDEPISTTLELSRTCFATYLVLKPGEERELRLEYRLPSAVLQEGTYRLYVQKQAGTEALPLRVNLSAPQGFVVEEGSLTPPARHAGGVTFETDLLVDRQFTVRSVR